MHPGRRKSPIVRGVGWGRRTAGAYCGAVMLAALTLVAVASADEPPFQAAARDAVGAGQGVFAVAADGRVLAAEAAAEAVHPASVTKIATTLALLERLGPDHRFTTAVRATGALVRGRLAGNLVVDGGNDPFFIDESALRVLQRLRARGVRTVGGRL